MATQKRASKAKAKSREVDIYYPKAVHHQTIAADGMWAALTTQLEIQIAFYKEIQPMPRRIRHKVTPQGGLGEITQKELDPGIVRETAVTVVINPAVAAQIIQLLQTMLAQVQPKMEASMKQMEQALQIEQQQVGVVR